MLVRVLPLLALTMALATARPAAAETLLRDAAPHAPLAGVSRVRPLALDPTALAELRGRGHAVVAGFPLGRDRTASVELERFQPFAAGARVEVVTGAGSHPLALPDHAYFRGTVRGEAGSRVVLIAARAAVRGFAVSGGSVYAFGPDGAGGHRSWALRDVDPGVHPPPGDFCANDLHADRIEEPAAHMRALIESGFAVPPVARLVAGPVLEAEVAIETDWELRQKFPSDTAALDYLTTLVAASSAIYERDVSVRLRFSYVRLWGTAADPWNADSTIGQLDEVQEYWTDPAHGMDAVAGPHDLVHFVSGKDVSGGVAYVGTVCNQGYAFGVSQVHGHFDVSQPSQIWDVLVFTHELGHNLGSPHTHCYDPPVDRCYNRERSCYDGAVVPSRGTIMSYCHLLSGGLANVDLVFGDAVSSAIRDTVTGAACLREVGTCGDGVGDEGEGCDDGNRDDGDGCSASCRVEGCGDGVRQAAEQCDDGNTVDGDGCSAACVREPRCGDAVVDAGEECDDGNTERGDGCSPHCATEPCTMLAPAQSAWVHARLGLQHGARTDRLALRGTFGISLPFTTLSPATSGMMLELEDATGAVALAVTLPGGGRWSARRGAWTYRDPGGSAAGLRKVVLRDRTGRGTPEVELTANGRGDYAIDAASFPLGLTVVLGDLAAGQAGACGSYTFDDDGCSTDRTGARLQCR